MENEFKDMDPSIVGFILQLRERLNDETYSYSFYDFDRIELRERDKMYIKIEEFKRNPNSIKSFCDEINSKLLDYEITNIVSILCGRTYKKSKANVPMQIPIGYHYSFTVVCRKKNNSEKV